MIVVAWQKASYSHEGANCLNIAAAGDGTLHLRESDDPDTVLAVTPASLRALLRTARRGHLRAGRQG
ncbi:DUF397 domain-containing protein [Streptomyces sp. DSM 40473]|uniref:DUF397 domain-containing protein n=1 Tax=Streptomyces hesseae TaxID=3075519 RepID=A0ABU2SWM5_9ACTN|nr:DUF397 domain-containing protein [Streptomyces sp. DSM 40473]MDT0452324.1 DUF397 domain-containing protein [Streptomyces sp. DSM 40473]